MGRKLSIVVIFFVQMLLLVVENHAEIVVSTVEAPAPQPHKNTTHFAPPPQPNKNTTHFPNNVVHVAEVDVQIRNTRNRVCFSARSVVRSACVCLLELMATSRFALATTTGRPKEEDPNAPEASKFHQ
ncbi:uncharacterized protein LOC114178624 isoform X2 [Vigna unguiculata]|uniref:uncharacterized protein LOC114178624 isoform X2 n=1 Tax=Vigna unguiculata TaxID=3917 RepID=UPI001016BF28|nr:uncharacterized protein LOC114178624 isoform X2 [Vigna unguiculata]